MIDCCSYMITKVSRGKGARSRVGVVRMRRLRCSASRSVPQPQATCEETAPQHVRLPGKHVRPLSVRLATHSRHVRHGRSNHVEHSLSAMGLSNAQRTCESESAVSAAATCTCEGVHCGTASAVCIYSPHVRRRRAGPPAMVRAHTQGLCWNMAQPSY